MEDNLPASIDTDILVIGAGVLGVCTAYWLSSLYQCRVALADMESRPGMHTTSRNTGVIHRPFYLHPERKRTFAATSDVSYPLWRDLALKFGLPWKPVGTLNVALTDEDEKAIEMYSQWGPKNGMAPGELELLDGSAVRALEPEVRCRQALLSKTDVSVDFGSFTRAVQAASADLGCRLLPQTKVTSLTRTENGILASAVRPGGRASIGSKFMVNVSGGGALPIAHSLGLGGAYAALHFRGEYWVVDEPFASRVTMNVYRPPRRPQFPFLDPHFVVRADGSRQIGPNAVMVAGPFVYGGPGLRDLASLASRPVLPKLNLFANGQFLSLVANEWRSSLSKRTMCERVRRFVPGLDPDMLNSRAVFGVRSSVIDRNGFVPEALLLADDRTAHVVNYNSPGATGAPAYSAFVVESLRHSGRLDSFPERDARSKGLRWDFSAVTSGLRRAGVA